MSMLRKSNKSLWLIIVTCLNIFYCRESQNVEAFYLRTKKDGSGFVNAPLGQHTLESKFREILAAGGFHGRYTLHSMRRTGATRMFSAGVSKQVIKMVSFVRNYENIFKNIN